MCSRSSQSYLTTTTTTPRYVLRGNGKRTILLRPSYGGTPFETLHALLRPGCRQILVQFSAPVLVTGSPALKLETGVIDREAVWVNASGVNSSSYAASSGDGGAAAVVEEVAADATLLLFEYTVVTGDETDDLDYWSDEEVTCCCTCNCNPAEPS